MGMDELPGWGWVGGQEGVYKPRISIIIPDTTVSRKICENFYLRNAL